MRKYHLKSNVYREAHLNSNWKAEKVPPFAPELDYTDAAGDHPVVFFTALVDKKNKMASYYWYIVFGENILDGRGRILRKLDTPSSMAQRSIATAYGVVDFVDYFLAVWEQREWPPPYLVIIDEKLSRFFADESDRSFLLKFAMNDHILIDGLHMTVNLYDKGKIKEIMRKKSVSNQSDTRRFYIQDVCGSMHMTIKRLGAFYNKKRLETRIPSELMQSADFTKRDLYRKGIFSDMRQSSDDSFLKWVLSTYGEATDLPK